MDADVVVVVVVVVAVENTVMTTKNVAHKSDTSVPAV